MDELIEGLLQADAYPHRTASISLVETHISWVLLTGDFAYKIKKPVKLPFVDFSTLARRKTFCEQELELNSRLAPELYLDVVPIADEGGPGIGREPAVEWAVKMAQFESDALASRAVRQNSVSAGAFRAFARTLAEFHGQLPAVAGSSARDRWRDNMAEIRDLADPELEQDLLAVRQWFEPAAERLFRLADARANAGAVRECHGDLHLENIVWLNERLIPFDCLEFDQTLRSIDVIDEVAFLAMDLMAADRSDLANEFLDEYLNATGDYAGVSVLRFFLIYRALVRAKVYLVRGRQTGSDDVRRATRYFRTAASLVNIPVPTLITTFGLSGSGKTTITNELIGLLPAIRIRSDVERKRLAGISAEQKTQFDVGEGPYDPESSGAVYQRLAHLAELALAAGFNVIVDAGFLQRSRRDEFHRMADRNGTRFAILHCRANPAELRQRVRQRAAEGRDASDAGVDVLDSQLENHDPLGQDEYDFAVTLDTTEPHDSRRLGDALLGEITGR